MALWEPGHLSPLAGCGPKQGLGKHITGFSVPTSLGIFFKH